MDSNQAIARFTYDLHILFLPSGPAKQAQRTYVKFPSSLGNVLARMSDLFRDCLFRTMEVHAKEIRILVADDYEPWRTQVRHLLENRPEWQIAGEACDGLDAVNKAAELHPDIVLLDIGMPRLNGVEAAKKIHDCSPESRIIFLTDFAYTEIREAAYTVGARAYVTKSHAFSELTTAIENAIRVH